MDLSCMERMEKELKCPICLDLIKSTISLSCNHIFCNDCIVKSMKSCSNCPVCKVPFQQREIRFAPNIDNLVSIYRTMEASSGIKSFPDSPEIIEETQETVDLSDGKSDPNQPFSQPAFPAKKRIQVLQHYDIESTKQNEHQEPKSKPGSPALSPFFWLREDEEAQENSSQYSEEDHQLTNSPPYVPSFSELLGYGCDSKSPNNKQNDLNQHDPFASQCDISLDNETIECTQMSYSPTVLSHPLKPAQKRKPALKKCSNKKAKISQESPIPIMANPSSTAEETLESKENTETLNQECSFCHTSGVTRESGEMVHYCKGVAVAADFKSDSTLHCHKNCAEWAPNVFFKEDKIMNLEREITRSKRIKCGICGLKGAALGCYQKTCNKSFHFTCAKSSPQHRFDHANFVMLCPLHSSRKLPNDVPKYPKKLVLCCSSVPTEHLDVVQDFAKLTKATLLKKWDPSVSHVVAFPDENGTYRRTFKVFMGILEGKWILSYEWVKDCLKAKSVLPENRYEVSDINGIKNGPKRGRERAANQEPKILAGLRFHLVGEFAPFYRSFMMELINAGGGSVLQRKPVRSSPAGTYVVYYADRSEDGVVLAERRRDAVSLADAVGATPVSNMWVLNSILACKLQS